MSSEIEKVKQFQMCVNCMNMCRCLLWNRKTAVKYIFNKINSTNFTCAFSDSLALIFSLFQLDKKLGLFCINGLAFAF